MALSVAFQHVLIHVPSEPSAAVEGEKDTVTRTEREVLGLKD